MAPRRTGGPLPWLAALAAVRCAGKVGDSYVLQRYKDQACSQLSGGAYSQQSWKRLADNLYCYDITSGFACSFGCNLRLECKYGSGSGVYAESMVEKSCVGQVANEWPLARDWTWLQVYAFFEGKCTPDADGTSFLRFQQPLGQGNYPNCSKEGNVATSTGESPDTFQAQYRLQFYNDKQCIQEYIPDELSTQTTSRYNWRVYRGTQYCYDSVDETPQNPNVSVRSVRDTNTNFMLICRNEDMISNGIMIQRYAGTPCTGRSDTPQTWRSVFYPMNFARVTDMFQGKCVQWSTFYVRFDRPWVPNQLPNCQDYACKTGNCEGGRIPTGDAFATYEGPIRTIPVATAGSAPAVTAAGFAGALAMALFVLRL